MSAFFVSQECMQRVVAGVDHVSDKWFGDYQIQGFGVVNGSASLSKLGTALYEMNDEALSVRYNAEPMFVVAFEYKPINVNLCSSLKAMECLSYQCSEGKVPETDLFRGLDKVKGDLASVIVNELPEYKQAEWGPGRLLSCYNHCLIPQVDAGQNMIYQLALDQNLKLEE